MKIGTLLRAGSLAVEIFNHQSTRQLSTMVKKGMERRGLWDTFAGQAQGAATRSPAQGTSARVAGPPAGSPSTPAPTNLPIRKALQYVTPENVQKAAQWHGILKSLIDKK